ncbi:MAG: hypothetical protein IKU55_00210, partial [Clostridia bacterium]|nr:hypothetical protein [Clostridia bacterium]
MRKIWLMLMTALMAAVLLGCGDSSLLSPDDPVALTMWHVYGEQADSPMNRLVDEFNATVGKEKGIVIVVTNVTSTSKILPQLVEAREGGPNVPDMPDLFSAHTITATEFGDESLLDWRTLFDEKELEAFVPQFLEDGMIGDALAVFPVSKSSYALFLNGSQFARFSADTGVTTDMLATWEGFFDVAAQYYAWSDGKTFCALDYLIRHVELDMMARRGEIGYTADGWYDANDASFYESWMKFAEPLAKGYIAVADQYANTQVMTGETLGGIGSTAAIAYYNETV